MKCENLCAEEEERLRLKEEESKLTRSAGEEAFLRLFKQVQQEYCDARKQLGGEIVWNGSEESLRKAETLLDEARANLTQIQSSDSEKLLQDRIEGLHLNRLAHAKLARVLVHFATELSVKPSTEFDEGRSPSSVSSSIGTKLEQIVAEAFGECATAEEDDEVREECVDPVWVDKPSDSEATTEAKNAVNEWETRLQQMKGFHDGMNYGPGQVWRALKKETFSLVKDPYTYKIVLFEEFRQDFILLGKFVSFDPDSKVMEFNEGQMCYSPAVHRSVRVHVDCGVETMLLDVSEPSTCMYEARLLSPAACVPKSFSTTDVASEGEIECE